MTTRTLHPLADAYLDQLEHAADHLPRARRKELVADIETHLLEALRPNASEAEVRNVLDRLGDPDEIAQADQPRPTPASTATDGTEWATITLLLIGGFFAGIGWLLGVFLLWRSRVWTVRDKLIGTLLWPGGLAASFVFFSSYLISGAEVCGPGECTDDGFDLAAIPIIAALLVPVGTAVYLARRAKHSSSS
jgi:uncharacterized membrane protein